MAWLKTSCVGLLLMIGIPTSACSGTAETSGSGGAPAAGVGGSSGAPAPAALGSVCLSDDESDPNFSGYGVADLNVDDKSAACSSMVCVHNHFQGRVSCPYGQTAAGGGCFLPGSNVPVAVPVDPQFEVRQASVASICSCRCAGSGPGPYCACPSSMECAPLLPDLGLGGAPSALSGSYCIPTGSEYDRTASAFECAPPACGSARPY